MNEINDLIREGELEFRSKVLIRRRGGFLYCLLCNYSCVCAVLVFFLQQSQGGGSRVMSFGKSRAKMTIDDKRKVTFNDVAGADEEKEELREIVEFLKNSKKFWSWERGYQKECFWWDSGTGKTLLAKAVSEKPEFRSSA